MKAFFKFMIALLIIIAVGSYFFWQKNKNSIIKEAIKTTIHLKSDSLYYIHYDSSEIDELNGNAAFYKVTLQSDSVQKKLLQRTDILPNALFTITVDKVSATGINMIGLLTSQNVSAKSILLYKPVIQIINTGVDKPKPFTYSDTLALYQKLLGKFKSIHADVIKVLDATILITNLKGKPLTTLENINLTLDNFFVDSTHDYRNLISYFIKDIKVTVANIQLPEASNGTRINITSLLYDAPQKVLQVHTIQQYKTGNTIPIIDVRNLEINKLNTNAFISRQQLKAGMVTCDGGIVTIYRTTKKKLSGQASIKLSANLIDEAQIDGIKLGNTKIIVIDPARPLEPAFIINNVKFNASDLADVTPGSTIDEIINKSQWQLSASKFSFLSKQKFYNFVASDIKMDNKKGTVSIRQILLKPMYTEQKFASLIKVQTDRFDFAFNNINLYGVNFKRMINDNILEVEHASMQPIIKIFNDATLPEPPNINISKYPQQAITGLAFQFYIKSITLNNGTLVYKEKSHDSKMFGSPSFTAINATIENATNVKSRIKINDKLNFKAETLFLNTAKLSTEWVLPLDLTDTVFTVKGQLSSFDAKLLNQISKPLGLIAVKDGKINSLVFNLNGGNYQGQGTATLLYNNLKIQVLKLKNEHIKRKKLLTFLANTIIKNDNPKNNNIYVSAIKVTRDMYSSFYSLLLKCILDGANKTILRK